VKTISLRKKVSAIAVASLGFGLLSVVPAQAVDIVEDNSYWTALTGGYGVPTYTGTGSTDMGGADIYTDQNVKYQALADGFVNVEFTARGSADEYTLKSTGSAGALFGTATDAGMDQDPLNGENILGGLLLTAVDEDDTVAFKVRGLGVGSQVITIKPITDAGATAAEKSVTATLTISWTAAAAAAISDANTTVYAAGAACNGAPGDTRSQILADKSADEITTSSAAAAINICVDARDGSGNQVTPDSVAVIGSLGGGAGDAAPAAAYLDLTQGVVTTSGKAAYTILITKDDALVTKTLSVTYFGSMATMALGNATYSALADGDTTYTAGSVLTSIGAAADGDIGTPSSADGALVVVAKDANGNLVDVSGATVTFTVDSDKVSGVPASEASDALGAVVVMSAAATVGGYRADFAELSGSPARVTCGPSAEKLTITAHAYTSAGVEVKTNPVTFYCAAAVSKVEVTNTGTSVNVNVTDANGYPVADGTEVTLAASNGSIVTPVSKTTANGKFATAPLFIGTSSASSSTVTALVGTKSGTSAEIVGTGGNAAISTSIAALNAKIVALNALIVKIMKRLNIKR
jgi:hypothetical protein